MNRRLISAFLLSGLLFFLLIAGMNSVLAGPVGQGVAGESAAESVPAEPLPEPVHITVQQRLPISVNLSQLGIPTETLPLSDSFALTLDLTLEFVVTDTMTSTVPSTVSLAFADDILNALPISLTLDGVTTATVVLIPQLTATETTTATAAVTDTPAVTATEPVTVEEPVTPTVEATPEITSTPEITVTPTVTPETDVDVVAPTSNVTANLRSGPGIDFDLVGTAPLGSELAIAGITEDAAWYLLATGTWIFADLVDNPPSDVPIATQELIAQVAADAAAAEEEAAEATPEPEATEEVVEEEATTEEATPTPAGEEAGSDPELVPTPTPVPEAPSTTADVNANLRAGPGTQYEQVGGTIAGQELDIVGQNAAGDWYLLSNGGWIAEFLVNNPPDDAPIVPDDASPLLTGEGTGPVLVPTPIPGQEATPEGEAANSISLGLAENLYLDEVRTLVSRYEVSGDAIEQLAASAAADAALFEDEDWSADMITAIATLQRSGQQIRALEPPPLFAAAHIDLRSAAAAYDEAATLLEQGLAETSPDQLREALPQINAGVAQLQAAQEKVSAVAQ